VRILYIAKHGSGHNDDEGAIQYGLEQLGHQVTTVNERAIINIPTCDFDFCLFHKLFDPVVIQRLGRRFPTIFWYFDLVETKGDRTLTRRNAGRLQWMKRVRLYTSLGFCTDGDWVANAPQGGKLCDLIQLTQGFDERLYLPLDDSTRLTTENKSHILFSGTIRNCGRERQAWFNKMEARYPRLFRHTVESFGRDQTLEVDMSAVAVCPPFPVTDRYYSNRVYNLAGRGATIIHPYSERLSEEYQEGFEILFYRNEEEMFDLTEMALTAKEYPDPFDIFSELGANAQRRTMKEHTYRHRCERLIEVVRDRFHFEGT